VVTRTVALALAVGALALVACSLVVPLGPEATPRDASVPAADASDDAAMEAGVDAPSVFPCGLPPDPNPTCETCNEQFCCDISHACANDPRCAAGIECLAACAYYLPCIQGCADRFGDAGSFFPQTQCAESHCAIPCSPGPVCSKLAQCCPGLTDPTNRQLCQGIVNALDEARCQADYQQWCPTDAAAD
jgi:hypothetical protein